MKAYDITKLTAELKSSCTEGAIFNYLARPLTLTLRVRHYSKFSI